MLYLPNVLSYLPNSENVTINSSCLPNSENKTITVLYNLPMYSCRVDMHELCLAIQLEVSKMEKITRSPYLPCGMPLFLDLGSMT